MVEEFVKVASHERKNNPLMSQLAFSYFLPFSFLLWTSHQASIFLAHCLFCFLFLCSYLLFYVDVTVVNTTELHGQSVVKHLIAVWICSMCWSSSGNTLYGLSRNFFWCSWLDEFLVCMPSVCQCNVPQNWTSLPLL